MFSPREVVASDVPPPFHSLWPSSTIPDIRSTVHSTFSPPVLPHSFPKHSKKSPSNAQSCSLSSSLSSRFHDTIFIIFFLPSILSVSLSCRFPLPSPRAASDSACNGLKGGVKWVSGDKGEMLEFVLLVALTSDKELMFIQDEKNYELEFLSSHGSEAT